MFISRKFIRLTVIDNDNLHASILYTIKLWLLIFAVNYEFLGAGTVVALVGGECVIIEVMLKLQSEADG